MMNRASFLEKLRAGLNGLEQDEIENVMSYYNEYFDDAGPEQEERCIEELGDPAAVAREVLGERAEKVSAAPKEAPKSQTGKNILLVILGIFAVPILLPILVGLASALLGVLIAVFTIPLVLFIVAAALLFTGFLLFFASFTLIGIEVTGWIFTMGSGLCMAGVAGLIGICAFLLTKVMLKATVAMFQFIFGVFHKRGKRV